MQDETLSAPRWVFFSFLSELPKEDKSRRLLLPIQAYIDESGGSGIGKVFVFAGFIGEAQAWARFSDSWEQCLLGRPNISYFKMQEAFRLAGEFKRWSGTTRDKKVQNLARVINSVPIKCIHYAIDLPDFTNHMADHWARPQRNPYFLGFFRILIAVCVDTLDFGNREEIEIIFDDNAIFAPRIRLWYPLIREAIAEADAEIYSVMPVEPLFRDDKQFLPLQAADMMAWLFRRDYEDRSTHLANLVVQELRDVKTSHCSAFHDEERMKWIVAKSDQMQAHLTPGRIRRWKNRVSP